MRDHVVEFVGDDIERVGDVRVAYTHRANGDRESHAGREGFGGLVAVPHVGVAGGAAVARRERDHRTRDGGRDRQDAVCPAARVDDGRVDGGGNRIDRQRAGNRDGNAAPTDVNRDDAGTGGGR